jgi:hypothetical protein
MEQPFLRNWQSISKWRKPVTFTSLEGYRVDVWLSLKQHETVESTLLHAISFIFILTLLSCLYQNHPSGLFHPRCCMHFSSSPCVPWKGFVHRTLRKPLYNFHTKSIRELVFSCYLYRFRSTGRHRLTETEILIFSTQYFNESPKSLE